LSYLKTVLVGLIAQSSKKVQLQRQCNLMSTELSLLMSDPEALRKLSTDQLIAIIFQQQQMIDQMQREAHLTSAAIPIEQSRSSSFQTSGGLLTALPHLVIKTDSGSYHLPLVGNNCWTIGRSEDNAVVLTDRWLSRNHAMLQCMGVGEFFLIDLGSRNGTFVNGRRVNVPVALQDGDRLTFGQTEIEFNCTPITGGIPLADSGGLSSVAEKASTTALLHLRRMISVLVVDIRNFTVLTRQLDERLLSEVIGTWFHQAGEIIRLYGSWVDKYIGDAVMAVWIHSTDDMNNKDKHEMKRIFDALQALNEMTSSLHLRYPLPFQLRIGAGINTGYAMVGNAGSGDRPEYTALGDTVNAAFRLETSTKQLGLDIALGVTTYQYLSPDEQKRLAFQRHVVSLKGYDLPVPTYAGSFSDLDTFLQIRTKVDDTLFE
jgi:adenylate cyclase